MSSAPADRTARSLETTSSVEPAVDGPENAPNSTPVIERPIARAINQVSIVPDAPTRVPATISSVLSST